MKHQLEEAEPVERLRPEVPAGVAAVLRRMMAKRREDRYQTPVEVATALGPFCVAELPTSVVPQPIPVSIVPAQAEPVLLEPASGDSPLVVLRPEAVPHRGRPAAGAWVWVAATGLIVGAVLTVLLILRLFRE
jgi:hypothetical protein